MYWINRTSSVPCQINSCTHELCSWLSSAGTSLSSQVTQLVMKCFAFMVYKDLVTVSTKAHLCQQNPLHILTTYFFRINFKIILPVTHIPPDGFHIICTKICMYFLFHSSVPPWSNYPCKYQQWGYLVFNFPSNSMTSSLLGQEDILRILFSNILNLYSSLRGKFHTHVKLHMYIH